MSGSQKPRARKTVPPGTGTRRVVRLEGLNPGGLPVSARVDRAAARLERGEPERADSEVRAVLRQHPEHLDALHLRALVARQRGEPERALAFLRRAVRITQERIPERLPLTRCLLPGDHAGNLPFLRVYCGLGLQLMDLGRVQEAFEVFATSLDMCFLDPFEARTFLPLPAFLLNRNRTVLELTRRYANDRSAPLLYGRPLAMIRLDHSREACRLALSDAVAQRPLVARLLACDRRPDIEPQTGARDAAGIGEAMDYWRMYADLWREAPGAMELLSELLPLAAHRA